MITMEDHPKVGKNQWNQVSNKKNGGVHYKNQPLNKCKVNPNCQGAYLRSADSYPLSGNSGGNGSRILLNTSNTILNSEVSTVKNSSLSRSHGLEHPSVNSKTILCRNENIPKSTSICYQDEFDDTSGISSEAIVTSDSLRNEGFATRNQVPQKFHGRIYENSVNEQKQRTLKETSFSASCADYGKTCNYPVVPQTHERQKNSKGVNHGTFERKLEKVNIKQLKGSESNPSVSNHYRISGTSFCKSSTPNAVYLDNSKAKLLPQSVNSFDSLPHSFGSTSINTDYGGSPTVLQGNGGQNFYSTRFEKNRRKFEGSFAAHKLNRGSVFKKTQRRRKSKHISQSQARRNSALLAKHQSYQPKAILFNQDISDNFYTALFAMLLCCPPLGLASLIVSFKVRRHVRAYEFEKAQHSSLLGRKLANTGIMLGITALAFGLIVFVLETNIPYTVVEHEYPYQWPP